MLIYQHQLEERFDAMLNEIHETISICGYDYDPARALKEIDPTAYRQEYLNWLDNELSEENIFEKDGEYYDSEDYINE